MNLRKVPTKDYVDEAHGPVFNFFSSLGNYILSVMSANVLFVVFNIPMIFVAFMVAIYFLPQLNPVLQPENFARAMEAVGLIGNEGINNSVGTEAAFQIYYIIVVFIAMFLLGSCLYCIGPFQAGFSQIYRNMYRREGVFFFTDFKEGMKGNTKQSSIAMAISAVVTFLLLMAITFYIRLNSQLGNAVVIMFTFLFLAFILVQNMVYQMIVSIDLPLKKIYMNAFLFFLIKFVPCVGLIVVEVLLLIVVPLLLFASTTYFGYALAIILYLTFSFGFCQYMLAFFTGEMIKNYIVTKLDNGNTDASEDDETDDESDEEDDEDEEDDDDVEEDDNTDA